MALSHLSLGHVVSTLQEHPLRLVTSVAGVGATALALGLGYLRWRYPTYRGSIGDLLRHILQSRLRSPHRSPFDSPPSKEHKLLEAVLSQAKEGNPQSVLKVIDDFAYEHWMMNVGDSKGVHLDEAIQRHKPTVMVELGAYCGYSAVRSAQYLDSNAKLVSIEFNALCSAIATKVVEHAGLADRVRVLYGNVTKALPRLRAITEQLGAMKIDLLFIDHDKSAYLPDLLYLEAAGMIRKGTVIVADNVVFPGAPEYLVYVRSSPHYQTRFVPGTLEYQDAIKDGLEISVCIADPVATGHHPKVEG